jgi:hypothetical protein
VFGLLFINNIRINKIVLILLKTKITHNEKCCGGGTNINVVELLTQKDGPVSGSVRCNVSFIIQKNLITLCQNAHYVIILQYMDCR